MEPFIYKPGAYKTPGVYKGAGGIYKGRGVYNIGSSILPIGSFIYLNNFENFIDNTLKSDVGPDFTADPNYFKLENSNIFSGKKCLKLYNNSGSVSAITNAIVNIPNDIITFETYFSNYTGYQINYAVTEVRFIDFQLECFPEYSKFRFGANCDNYTLYNNATLFTIAGAHYFHIPISYNEPCHFALVIDFSNNTAYLFGNGVLYVKCEKQNGFNKNDYIRYNCENYSVYLANNFISIRNGDMSNNLNSFDVPTQKYSL